MARLPRPHIPLSVRAAVAERQMLEATGCLATDEHGVALHLAGASFRKRLDAALFHLSEGGKKKLELHHRPALVNRRKIKKGGQIVGYDPPANSAAHLFYLDEAEHDVETRVRGLRGQHSDLALARKNKRIAKNRDPNRVAAKIPQRRNPWPTGRKIQNRRKP